MAENMTPVQVALWDNDNVGNSIEVTDATHAREVVDELLDSSRKIESDGAGGWLVDFTDDELAQLQENGWYGLDNDGRALEAEWI